jgi:signal transduction histidine kinase
MRQLVREGFDRRVLLPLLAAIALVVAAFFVAEARRAYTRELSEIIQQRQDRMREMAELIYVCIEAESAQRGYLLTGEAKYAEPYDQGRALASVLIASLVQNFSGRNSEELPALRVVQKRIEENFAEMDETLRMMQAGHPREALAAVKTDVGLYQMREIRDELEALRARERARIYESLTDWSAEIRVNSLINLVATVFTVVLLIAVGLLATREIRRRQAANEQLDRLVRERTADLQELSTHMLRMGELEKSALARELHDELGGLLIAMRMDLVQLRRRIVLPDEDAQTRWARVNDSLASGVELKRRIIEELRPTLLDNLGLVAAVRWQVEQSTALGGLALEVDLPEEEPELADDAAIAIFRSVQEALSNILKHARATRVKLSMRHTGQGLRVAIEDDGVGLQADATTKPGSHGLKQMSFRMQAVGGEIRLASVLPHGTLTILIVPVQALR